MTTEPFTPEDIYLYSEISELQGSPVEPLVACSIEICDRAQDARVSSLWCIPLDGGAPWRLTAGGPWNDTYPRWSPDGQRVALVSSRLGSPQVFTIARTGGEAALCGTVPGSVMSAEWSPDGTRLAVLSTLRVDPALRGKRAAPGQEPPAPDAPQIVWKLPYKADGVGYVLDQETHLFCLQADGSGCLQLTDGPFNVRGAAWSPDGQQIAFARTREGDAGHRTDLWCMRADGSGARQISSAQAQVLFPVWSPDGATVVFSGTLDEGDAQVRLWRADVATGVVEGLGSESIELATEGTSVQFLRGDPSRLLAVVAEQGVQKVVAIDLADGLVSERVTGDRHVSALAQADGRLAFVSESAVDAHEVHTCRPDGTQEKQLTRFNGWWNGRTPATLTNRHFEVPDGQGGLQRVQGWLIRPQGAVGPTPLLLDFHGGPASYALFDYPAAAYWPVFWSAGWSILALNASGSASFGRPFAEQLRGRWGELDLPQHLAALEQLRSEGIADEKFTVIGKSYGGFLSAWAVGHAPQVRAAVVMAPPADMAAHFGTSDSGYYVDPYLMAGDLAQARETYERLSAVRHVGDSRVPTLILQGGMDDRCPRGQAEALFVALKRGRNPPCELVLYPEGSHTFNRSGKPSMLEDAVQRVVEWMQRYVDGVPAQE